MLGMTQTLSRDLTASGITVSTIILGAIDTDPGGMPDDVCKK